MVDRMPLLVDQLAFEILLHFSPDLNLNLNRKTRDKFWDSNSNLNFWSFILVLYLSSYPTLDTSVQHSHTPQITQGTD
jgi:hypothetical protein